MSDSLIPFRAKQLERPAGEAGHEGVPEGKLSVEFDARVRGPNPLAVLQLNHADKAYKVTYPMNSGAAHAQAQHVVSGIQRRYTDTEQDTLAVLQSQRKKDPAARLADQVNELLGYQEALEIAATLNEGTRYDQREDLKQRDLLDKLNFWYADVFRVIRDEIRDHSGGLAFVRELITSEKEMLVDLGVRLAREPSIRAALQGDLVRVFTNPRLAPRTRERAFSYLRTEVRRDLSNTE